jgi:hypothetical protein
MLDHLAFVGINMLLHEGGDPNARRFQFGRDAEINHLVLFIARVPVSVRRPGKESEQVSQSVVIVAVRGRVNQTTNLLVVVRFG